MCKRKLAFYLDKPRRMVAQTLLLLLCLTGELLGQNPGEVITLKGYIIVSSYDSLIRNGCSLDIANTKDVEGDGMKCSDGNFYKNISYIQFIAPEDLDIGQLDDFTYRVDIQEKEHLMYLSVNPAILKGADPVNPAISQNPDLIKAIEANKATAEAIQAQLESLRLKYKKREHYYVLMEVSVQVLVLPDRKPATTFRDNHGLKQFVLLHDSRNRIKAVKVIKDGFH